MNLRSERGGVIMSGLLRTAAWLSLFCVLAFDTGGIVTNRILLDEAARVAASQAAQAASSSRHLALQAATEAARESLKDQKGTELVEVAFTGDGVALTVRRRATVLVADHVNALEDQVLITVTATASLDR